MNRYPLSKASRLAAGKARGRERVGWEWCRGEISRQRADTIKSRENELFNTSIKNYKTRPPFFMLPGLLCRQVIRCLRVAV